MFEKELSLIHEYISDLDNTPIFGSLSEDKRISYRKFAAEEIEGKLLEEELNIPAAIKDRMPFTAGEIVDDYISDLKKCLFKRRSRIQRRSVSLSGCIHRAIFLLEP